MTTQDDLELLNAYIDGALNDQERAALDARLQDEPALRREYESLRATAELLRALPTLRSPRDLTLTRAAARSARVYRLPTAAISFASAAASILLILAGLTVMRPVGETAQRTPSDQAAASFSEAATTDILTDGVIIAGLPTASLPPTQPPAATLFAAEATMRLPTGSPMPADALALAPLPGELPQQTAQFFAGAAQDEIAPTETPLASETAGDTAAAESGLAAVAPAAMVESEPGGSGATPAEEVDGEADILTKQPFPEAQDSQMNLQPTMGMERTLPTLAEVIGTPTRDDIVMEAENTDDRSTLPADEGRIELPSAGEAALPDGWILIGMGAVLGVVTALFTLWARRR
ncbi:MAG: hypothetical protein L6Q98_10405 [Anaerolineae bacterium]|nr:hypothetical protein [Anaerolineae bacterium]NUQ03211.1 hypothetical protein [Anaerolineae bacterium]